MMSFLRKIIPKSVLLFYHKILAYLAAFFCGWPSKKLIVIGVTGTTGKTTACNFIYQILQKSGKKCAMATTANFAIGDREWLNRYKQTMLGRFKLQKFLRRAVEARCKYCVIEVSSQGVEQWRHIGIDFDSGVFTNLFPEHIEAHGGFENYKKAKLNFFKVVKNKIVVNGDSKYAEEFLDFGVEKKMTYCIKSERCGLKGVNIRTEEMGIKFQITNNKAQTNFKFQIPNSVIDFRLNMLGEYNVYNTLAAIGVCLLYGVKLNEAAGILQGVKLRLGRMEFIDEGQTFKIIVDYAFEPVALKKVYRTVNRMLGNLDVRKLRNYAGETRGRLISVLGSCGGGRDAARRSKLGGLAAKYADVVVVTNEDSYDDDPREIIEQVIKGALEGGKELKKDLFRILDRREAISFALKKAREGDVVLITGKGCEQMIMTGPVGSGEGISWDDRRVVRKELKKLKIKN